MTNQSETLIDRNIIHPLYEGDTGTLTLPQRQLLVNLIRGPYISKEKHPALWETLLNSQNFISSALANLFLSLVIDTEAQVAFCRQAKVDDIDVPATLLRQFTLTFLDSLLFVELRERLMAAEKRAEHPHISTEEIEDLLKLYDKSAKNNELVFKKHVNAVISRFVNRGLLHKINDDLFRVPMYVKYFLTPQELESLKMAYSSSTINRESTEAELLTEGETGNGTNNELDETEVNHE